jgi:TRAP-type C4-dicarboxylate transport system permease small subunit
LFRGLHVHFVVLSMITKHHRTIGFLGRLERVVTAISAGILGLLACVVTWEVFARYVLQSGQFWAEEFCLVGMMWAALLGAAACLWTDSHVRVTIVLSLFPARVRMWILTLMDGIILWFAFLIFKEGIFLIERTMGGTMSALRIPIGATYYVLPLSAFLMFLFALIRALKRIASLDQDAGGGH